MAFQRDSPLDWDYSKPPQGWSTFVVGKSLNVTADTVEEMRDYLKECAKYLPEGHGIGGDAMVEGERRA